MNSAFKELRDKIKKENEDSKIRTKQYEIAECWNFAYLSRWVVLERGLKALYNIHNKGRIRAGAQAWLEYLDGKRSIVPGKIKDFSVETRDIPSLKFIKEILGTSNSIKTAIASDGKYRKKRNQIAHKAEGLETKRTYPEYRKTIDSAITQLIRNLSNKINKQ